MVRKDQTSDAQLRIGESRDSGLDAEPVSGPRVARTRWHRPGMTECGLLRRFAPRKDDKSRRAFTPPRRDAPESLLYLPPFRGRGERRVPVAPAASCALCSGRTHTSNNEYTGITRRSRTQWFYDLFRALPGDRAVLPPSSADMFCLSPVGPTQLRELDTSVGVSGPHDFAVRSNISRPRAGDRSQASSTRPAIPSHAKRCRVHRNPPRVRDDHDTPLLWGGMRKVLDLIWGEWEQKYFSENQK
jgi:hypothetical protein